MIQSRDKDFWDDRERQHREEIQAMLAKGTGPSPWWAAAATLAAILGWGIALWLIGGQ